MHVFTAENDGFIGAYYGGPSDSRKAAILMVSSQRNAGRPGKTSTGNCRKH